MEPVFAQIHLPPVLRPATALQSDLSAVLREGRVLAGEVLQSLGGGTVLVGIGRHRVPARSQVEMQPGQRFLFQVVGSGDQLALRLIAPAAEGESALLRALRRVAGLDRPAGELLTELERVLTAPRGRGELDSHATTRLLAELDAHVFRAGLSGEELRRILRRSGAGYEAGLVREGLGRLGPGRGRALGRRLAQSLLEGLASSPEPPAGEPPERGIAILREALREAVLDALRGGGDEEGKGPPRARPLPARAPGGLEELARDLPEILRKGIARLPEGALRQRATARLPRVIGRLGGLELRCLVARILGEPLEEGTAGERARGAAAEGIEPDPAPLDLKGKLLAALRELPEGRLRSALIRAAGGIEAEQLLNLARQESGEPLHWSLPVAEGSRLSSAHLFHQRTWEDAEGSRAPGAPLHRLTLAVDLTGTGAVRADLVLRADSLSVRVLAAEEEVAERLRQEIPALVQALAAGGRRVGVRVDTGSLEEVEVGERALDIQLLRERHLMDVEG